MNTHCPALLSDGCSQTVNQIRVSNGSQQGLVGKFHGGFDPPADPVFCIHTDHEGNFSTLLIGVCHQSLTSWAALKEDDAPDVILFNGCFQVVLVHAVFVAIGCNHDQLSDLFIQAHGIQR